jgi:predicted amidohydrolase
MRTLALRGAELILHPSNLILPYCPHVMPYRCLENRVFAITANRIGVESRKNDQTLRFIGMSQIASPLGEILARASDDQEELLTVEINPELARNKSINPYNDLFKDRRPEMYVL